MITIRHHLFFVLYAIVAYGRAFGNGDPVVSYSSIHQVANPEPLSISEISITHEQVSISHLDGYNCFDITYHFVNDSDKDFPEIHYGFPIDYLISDEQETFRMKNDYLTESIYETGWCDKLIKDISFTFNDLPLEYHSARESVCEAGYSIEIYDESEPGDTIPTDAVNRRWYYTQFAMSPHSEAVFNVRYKVYANSRASLYSDHFYSLYSRQSADKDTYILNHPLPLRYFATGFTILYDFSPAKHFGDGRPYKLDINVDLSNLKYEEFIEPDGYEYQASCLKRSNFGRAEDIKPIYLPVFYSDFRNHKDVRKRISPYIIPESRYMLQQSEGTVEIEFPEPTFVSDLACDIDTALVRRINATIDYSDGHTEKYIYERGETYECIIQNPTLLTITDLYHDGMKWTEAGLTNHTGDYNKPELKINKITLHHDVDCLPSGSQSPIRDIQVLDCRFYVQ